MVCRLPTLQRIHRTPFNVLRSLMLPTESPVSRLGFFGLWNYFIPSCEIQQVHSSHLTQLYWNQLLGTETDLPPSYLHEYRPSLTIHYFDFSKSATWFRPVSTVSRSNFICNKRAINSVVPQSAFRLSIGVSPSLFLALISASC